MGTLWKKLTYSHYPQMALVCRISDHFIHAFATAQGPKPDVDEFRPLIAKAAKRTKFGCVVADAGDDSKANHRDTRAAAKPGRHWVAAQAFRPSTDTLPTNQPPGRTDASCTFAATERLTGIEFRSKPLSR
jgi:hypothetical protein